MKVALLIAILVLIGYQMAFSPVFQMNTYSEVSYEKPLVKKMPDKFIFYYAHAGFSNQLFALQR
jgi:hypothetical protein